MSTRPNPKVSVILPAYNAEKYIDIAIRSILDQTFEDFELIIVDDGSTDETFKIIERIKNLRIRVIRHKKNKGVCEARNTAIEAARGEWIAPIDADDGWHRRRLEKLLRIAEEYPDSFVGSDKMLCFSGPRNEFVPSQSFLKLKGLETKSVFLASTLDLVKYGLDLFPIIPRKVVVQNNIKFRREFRGHDWLYFLLKLFRFGLQYVVVPEPLYYYRLIPGSKGSTYRDMETQLYAIEYLQSVKWLNRVTKNALQYGAKVIEYRLFTTSLREKKWDRAIYHLLKNPESIFYFFWILPKWIKRKRNQRLAKRSKDTINNEANNYLLI